MHIKYRKLLKLISNFLPFNRFILILLFNSNFFSYGISFVPRSRRYRGLCFRYLHLEVLRGSGLHVLLQGLQHSTVQFQAIIGQNLLFCSWRRCGSQTFFPLQTGSCSTVHRHLVLGSCWWLGCFSLTLDVYVGSRFF